MGRRLGAWGAGCGWGPGVLSTRPWRWGDVRRLLTDGLRAEGLRGGDLFPLSPGSGAGWAGAWRPSPEPSEPEGQSPDVNSLSVLWMLRARCLLLSLHFLNITGEKTTPTSWGRAAGTERKGSENKRSSWSSCECSVNDSCSLTCTHTHTDTHTHTHAHAHTHTCTRAHIHTDTHVCTHRHAPTHPCTCAHRHAHLHIYVHTHARAHTHTTQRIPSKKTGTRGGPSPLGRSGNRALHPPAWLHCFRSPFSRAGHRSPGATCPEGAPAPTGCGWASQKPPPEQAACVPRLPRLTQADRGLCQPRVGSELGQSL